MIILSFCIFIWILMRSSSNIASIMLRFMKSCSTSWTRLKHSLRDQSISEYLRQSLDLQRINARHNRHHSCLKFVSRQNSIRRAIKDQERRHHHRQNVHYLRQEISYDKRTSWTTQSQTRSWLIRRRTKRSRQKTQAKKRQRRRPKIQFENRWRKKKQKIYIVINLEILTIMNAMFRQIAYWILNTICFCEFTSIRNTRRSVCVSAWISDEWDLNWWLANDLYVMLIKCKSRDQASYAWCSIVSSYTWCSIVSSYLDTC
jgi:hypothetical protein